MNRPWLRFITRCKVNSRKRPTRLQSRRVSGTKHENPAFPKQFFCEGGGVKEPNQTRVAIACQGGGSHTAFSAGVLKAILFELVDQSRTKDEFQVVALSGTSGGAICALLAWDGLIRQEPELGIQQLDTFWKHNAASDPWSAWVNLSVQIGVQLRNFLTLPEFNPYAFPNGGQQQLQALLEGQVNFKQLQELALAEDAPGLLMGAVDVRSGLFRVFPGQEISVEAVLASTAVPDLFPAVEVKGRMYWDGLFSQNPPIRELMDYKPDELWIIQINPSTCMEVPKTINGISDRRNELAGNLSLEQELRFVEKINELLRENMLTPKGKKKYKPITLFRITLKRELDYASKLDRSPDFIENLMAYGEAEARRFLEERRSNPGWRSKEKLSS